MKFAAGNERKTGQPHSERVMDDPLDRNRYINIF